MILFGPVFARLSKPVRLQRMLPETVSYGVVTPGETQDFEITAVVQPFAMKDVLRLPEGQRTQARIYVWTRDQIETADRTQMRTGDLVEYADMFWEVESIQDWDQLGTYRQAIAVRVGQ